MHRQFVLEGKGLGRGRPWRGAGIGALGLLVACAGCCLAPLFGVLLGTGAGIALMGFLTSRPFMPVGGAGLLGILMYSVWRSRRTPCCDTQGTECGSNACAVRDPGVDEVRP